MGAIRASISFHFPHSISHKWSRPCRLPCALIAPSARYPVPPSASHRSSQRRCFSSMFANAKDVSLGCITLTSTTSVLPLGLSSRMSGRPMGGRTRLRQVGHTLASVCDMGQRPLNRAARLSLPLTSASFMVLSLESQRHLFHGLYRSVHVQEVCLCHCATVLLGFRPAICPAVGVDNRSCWP